MFDLISIGDSTIDVFLELHEAAVNCEIDPKECKLLLDYADKIPVEKVTRVAAVGNAANNAIGSARLGLKTALYTIVGDDQDGREMRDVFMREKVASDYMVTDVGKRSNFSVVLNFKGERTILVYHENRTYNLPDLADARWVYFTSVGKGHEILHEQVPLYCRKSGAKLAFQPGSHQIREGKGSCRQVMAAAEVVIVNTQEAKEILEQESEIPQLLKGLVKLGPKIAVITNGEEGSWSFDGETVRFATICQEKKMVERTGAGDAYSTGLVAALILGEDIGEAMRWGSANASSVVEHIGAREGLLTREGVEGRLEGCPECRVETR